MKYRIAGYFHGVLIFVIFMVSQNFPPTKFSTHTAVLSTLAKI